MPVAENVASIYQRILDASRRAGRDPSAISLMAVSKTFRPSLIREAYNCGIRLFGESRIQEFSSKIDCLRDLQDIAWHMIGHLQTNKAAKAAHLFNGVDSIDSLRQAEKLNSEAVSLQKKLPILIEINVGAEAAKSGLTPDTPELERLLLAAPILDHLQLNGLMSIPPFFNDPQQSRPYFRKLRHLRDRIAARNLPGVGMQVLSMGMSHDFEVAIDEGATCVRIGTAIFGDRQKIP